MLRSRTSSLDYNAIVIGGGFYGCSVARHLASAGARGVLVLEAGNDLMTRASYANQARVHQGYHYPRSLLTALRSRVNFTRFVSQYRDAVVDTLDMYYAVARRQSNVTAEQFVQFCARIGAPLHAPAPHIERLFDADLVERVFRVREYAFDADRLRRCVKNELDAAGVRVKLGARAASVREEGGLLLVKEASGAGHRAARVFNCTYSGLNQFLSASGLPPIPLKHEVTELALVQVPSVLADVGITVMCGPFFSIMPFPARGLHSLSHVRYTPHFTWHDAAGTRIDDGDATLARLSRRTAFPHMLRDVQRYVPALAGCQYVESLWEVKTVLPRSEVDDSRPILHRRDHGLKSLTCVLGSKIDSVYDVLDEIVTAMDVSEAVR